MFRRIKLNMQFPTLSEVAEEFLIERRMGRSAKTVTNYEWQLSRFLKAHGHEPARNLKRLTLQKFILKLRDERPIADSSINGIVRGLKAFVKWLKANDYLDVDLSGAIHQFKIRSYAKAKPTNAKTVKLMLELAPKFRDEVILLFAADTGARVGEIATLTIDNLKLDELRAFVTGKVGGRWVTFTEVLRDKLIEYLKKYRPDTGHDFVFCGIPSPHKPLAPHGIYAITRRIAAKIEEPHGPTNPHSFRHWVCLTYVRKRDLYAAQKKLGHQNVKTTIEYAHGDTNWIQTLDPDLSALNDLDLE